MKKLVVLILLVCGVFMTLDTAFAGVCDPVGGRIEVRESGQQNCIVIQDAIDASVGLSVTIEVMPGIYTEDLVMGSNIHLQGSGAGVTILQSYGGSDRTVIRMNGIENVEVSGFTIQGGGINNVTGIWSTASDTIIRNNTFTNMRWAIYNDGGASPFIRENTFESDVTYMESHYIIYNEPNSNPVISNNYIAFSDRAQYAIYNDNASPLITGNTLECFATGQYSCFSGIRSLNSSSAIISNNYLKGNIGYVIYVDGSSDSVINNVIELTKGYWGINARNSSATISGNIITGPADENDTGSAGIVVDDGVTATNNKIRGTKDDILAYGSGANVSFNTYSSVSGTFGGAYNVKYDGTPW